MNETEYANATPEERKAYDDMCRNEALSEMAAERYNDMGMGGFRDFDPEDDIEREREANDEWLCWLRSQGEAFHPEEGR